MSSSPQQQNQQQEQQQQGSASEGAKAAEEELLRGGILVVLAIGASFLVLKVLAVSLTLSVFLLPLAYVYGLQTCPPLSSFDAKSELRSVLKGDQLPADDPKKPKYGTFAGFLAGAKATLATELATLPGYEMEYTSYGGAFWWVVVTLPTADLRCTWIGCNHRWYYWGSSKLSAPSGNASGGDAATPAAASETTNLTIGKTKIQIDKNNIKIDFGKRKNKD